MRTNRHEAKGFTLLELVVAVGILGILLAIAVPGVAGYLRSARLQGSAQTLASDLHYARSLATSQRSTFAVAFAADSYSVVRVSPPTTVLTRRLPDGVAVAAPDTTSFFPWGLTQAATFTLSDAGRSSTVNLLATGSVSHD